MGLEEIVKEIKARGKAEAEKIRAETEKEVSSILEKAKAKAEKIKAEKQQATMKEIEKLRMQELSSAHLVVKRELLNARKQILEQVYEKAVEELKQLPPEKNQEILKTIIEKHQDNNSKIYSRSEDRQMVKKLTKLRFAGEIKCIGGVVIENEDGTEVLDFKYDTILKNVSEQSLKQVYDILFGEQ